LADALALKGGKAVSRRAENAALLVLLEHNALALKGNLYTVTLFNFQRATHLFGDNNAAELVDATDDTCGFHRGVLLSSKVLCHYFTIFSSFCQVWSGKFL
jgi:hypothetical protein